MNTQWHPLFAHLLRLLLDEYYEVRTEVPVSELPRQGDIMLLRRHPSVKPPFQGLWSHLTEWNVFEFKGPTDSAEEVDLELLVHVGTGLTCRFNEERRARQEEALANHQVSFWYLVPTLGETFLGHARGRTHFDYQTGGLWRGRVWGHPVWLVSYQDLPVEEVTIPLHLLDSEPTVPRSLGELVVQRQELLERFAMWLKSLQPELWKEMRHMASTVRDRIIDWEALGKIANLEEVVPLIPPDRVIAVLGVDRAIQTIGLDRVIEVVGLPRVLETVGLPRLIETVGLPRLIETVGLPRLIETVDWPRLIAASEIDKVLEALLKSIPREKLQELLRRTQQE
jgi:hypothetical protein